MSIKKWRNIILNWTMAVLVVVGVGWVPPSTVLADGFDGCADVEVVFVRGSGGTRWESDDYLALKTALDAKTREFGLNINYHDLDYPAVPVGIVDVGVSLGAVIGAGEAYEFGRSVEAGVQSLMREVNGERCPDQKYVLAGYSQGAMVVSKALGSLKAERVIYAATFGDPKLYLPEGEASGAISLPGMHDKNLLKTGAIPAACKGENLSDYRAYVPDCYAYEGLLGSYRPYRPEVFRGKLGTWCNSYDIFCSSALSLVSHVSYVSDALYDDASKVMAQKIAEEFGGERKFVSAHDTAFLIDTTGSMSGLIDRYRAEALKLARETFEYGGRVALYEYGDVSEKSEPIEHCNFESCTLEVFETELNGLKTSGGGDTPESLLSGSFTMMQKLEWRIGATKSVVALTDAGFHSPDLDNVTLADVVKLSKEIDPVNFYVISPVPEEYEELTRLTDGKAVSTVDDLSLVSEAVMARVDSLPRVVEELDERSLPTVEVTGQQDDGGAVTVDLEYRDGANSVIVTLNDAVLGVSRENKITVTGLDRGVLNELRLVAVSDERRGEAAVVSIPVLGKGAAHENVETVIPKTPNTGVSATQ